MYKRTAMIIGSLCLVLAVASAALHLIYDNTPTSPIGSGANSGWIDFQPGDPPALPDYDIQFEFRADFTTGDESDVDLSPVHVVVKDNGNNVLLDKYYSANVLAWTVYGENLSTSTGGTHHVIVYCPSDWPSNYGVWAKISVGH